MHAADDIDERIAFAEDRYPYPFLHHSFSFWNKLGFAYLNGGSSFHNQDDFRMFGVTVPFWFLFCVSVVPPSLCLARRVQRKHRTAHGRCAVCGYDLRATPQRCPECGTESKVNSEM